jgi:hypothetical protein
MNSSAHLRERLVGTGRVGPPAAFDVDDHLAQEALGVLLARERLAALLTKRVAVPRAIATVALLDEPRLLSS